MLGSKYPVVLMLVDSQRSFSKADAPCFSWLYKKIRLCGLVLRIANLAHGSSTMGGYAMLCRALAIGAMATMMGLAQSAEPRPPAVPLAAFRLGREPATTPRAAFRS